MGLNVDGVRWLESFSSTGECGKTKIVQCIGFRMLLGAV